jgi:nucleoside-diphosphate-sugar epimerase
MLPDRRDSSDPQRRRPDITRAKQVLDWEPSILLESGLADAIEDFRSRL